MDSNTMTIDQVLGMSEQLSTIDRLRLISLLSDRWRREIAEDPKGANLRFIRDP